LQVINLSPGDLAPVFDAMLEKALYLCGAAFGQLWTYDGEVARVVASRNVPERYREHMANGVIRPDTNSFLGKAIHERRFIHIADNAAEEPYLRRVPIAVSAVELAGVRTFLHVPLINDNAVLGIFTIFRQEVRPFSDKQIALLQNFAAQAVIAMENPRLINETREALDQQTATAEVLQVINSSPGDLAPVFDAMLEKAVQLCDANFGILWRFEDGLINLGATYNAPAAFLEFHRAPRPATPDSGPGRLMRGEPGFAIENMLEFPPYAAGDVLVRAIVDLAGARSVVTAPLRKDGTALGMITIYRQETRPFSDKQLALLQNFAAQAVIAMENARLIAETREALEQQTATAEILQVINASPGDLAPVFECILDKARTLCDTVHGDFWTYDGECFNFVATYGEPGFAEWLQQQGSVQPWPGSPMERVVQGEAYVHLEDALQDDSF
jgi:GAF domain-containing protein